VFKHPLAGDDSSVAGFFTQHPGVVGLKGVEFQLHGCTPLGIAERNPHGRWYG
jgi:hypothetical protein